MRRLIPFLFLLVVWSSSDTAYSSDHNPLTACRSLLANIISESDVLNLKSTLSYIKAIKQARNREHADAFLEEIELSLRASRLNRTREKLAGRPLDLEALNFNSQVYQTAFDLGAIPVLALLHDTFPVDLGGIDERGDSVIIRAAQRKDAQALEFLSSEPFGSLVGQAFDPGSTSDKELISQRMLERFESLSNIERKKAIYASKLVNYINPRTGTSALMIAIRNEDINSIEALMKAGADPYIRDSKGKTAFQLAKGRLKRKEIEALLKTYGPPRWTSQIP